MAINVTAIKCPSCGANLPLEVNKNKMYCPYCGTPIIITNENEYIIRYIDENKNSDSTNKVRKHRNALLFVGLVFFIAVIAIGIVVITSRREDERFNDIAYSTNSSSNEHVKTDVFAMDISAKTNKEQKNSTKDEVEQIVVGGYSYLIPQYFDVATMEPDLYRAYAETGDKAAFLMIGEAPIDESDISEDYFTDQNLVAILKDDLYEAWAAVGNIDSQVFDNGNVMGTVFGFEFEFEIFKGRTLVFMFPDVKNGKMVNVVLEETDNTDFAYTKDFYRILLSIKANE